LRIAIVGAGYVGLVAGTCFAETGHNVSIVDIDAEKIGSLQKGEVPFYEPGLKDLLKRNIREKRLFFTTEIEKAVLGARVAFVAVGTPEGEDGSADVSHVMTVARQIGKAMDGPLVVVNKSTVPVGTGGEIEAIIKKETTHPVTVVSNPEFLKEGAAVDDFMRPDRVVVGTEDPAAVELMTDLYAPFVRTGNPILFMDRTSAELAKYAANGLLASRISFMNEIALLCDAVGADVEKVRRGVGSDARIGHAFLFPGAGFGGSCFPKDVRALIGMGKRHGIEMEIAAATYRANQRQKLLLPGRVKRRFGADLSGRTFALWGLAFKPRTDDVREAPALVLIEELLAARAAVRVYDPEAMESARRMLGERVCYCQGSYDCCQGADALIVATEWNEFRFPDFERIKQLLKEPVVFDGRNLYDPQRMRKMGFEHISVRRQGPA
jgi:UDPglucose 6-dehydrogenase